MSSTEDVEDVAVAEDHKSSEEVTESDMANGGLKDTKDNSRGFGEGRGYGTGGRGGYRGSRGGFRGSYRGKRGSGMTMNTKYLDAKAMYLQFEDAINSITANEILEYGREAVSVGFGRGCTLHFKTPEEAKEMIEKIKEHTFCGLEAKVEYAYRKREQVSHFNPYVFLRTDPEKRSSAGDDSEASPNKKAKVEGQEEEVKDKEEEEDSNDGKEVEGEEEPEGEEEGEGEGDEEMEGDDEGEEEHIEGDYGEGAQDENEDDEYEDTENPEDGNEDDEDDDV